MKLIFLGSGSAFTVGSNNYQSNMILQNEQDQRLLIDCGSDVRLSLFELGLTYLDIKDVYISHLHADHAGGLEWLAFTTKFDPRCKKPNLYASVNLIEPLWQNVLSGGLNSIADEHVGLKSFFNVHGVKDNEGFVWNGLPIMLIQTVHVVSEFYLMPSYGLQFTVDKLKVFITTDTQFCPNQIRNFYDASDLIFHDCETFAKKSLVHAHYSELLTLPASIKNKMWLYHYNPGNLPDCKKDGFRGFVKKGQCFDFNDSSTL